MHISVSTNTIRTKRGLRTAWNYQMIISYINTSYNTELYLSRFDIVFKVRFLLKNKSHIDSDSLNTTTTKDRQFPVEEHLANEIWWHRIVLDCNILIVATSFALLALLFVSIFKLKKCIRFWHLHILKWINMFYTWFDLYL